MNARTRAIGDERLVDAVVAQRRLRARERRFGSRLFSSELPSELASIRLMREAASDAAARRGMTGSELTDVALAVSEAATNAVRHGSRAGDAVVRLSVEFDEQGDMCVVVSDDGVGLPADAADRSHGYGLSIMRTVTKDLRIVTGEAGTEVHMSFACPARTGPPADDRLAVAAT